MNDDHVDDGFDKYRRLADSMRLHGNADQLRGNAVSLGEGALELLQKMDEVLSARNPNMPRFVESFLKRAIELISARTLDVNPKHPIDQVIKDVDASFEHKRRPMPLDMAVCHTQHRGRIAKTDPDSWPGKR